jgi:fatty acid desaturase
MPTPHPQLNDEQIEALGQELDELRNRVMADLGERDAAYIRRIIKTQRGLEILGRALLEVGFLPPAWVGGTAALSLSKILDNMEIGHNVMHGQYDWMKDPGLDSKRFEWDTACPSDQWRYSHNYMHHTHTNVLGKDRDIGYGVLRMSEDQPWRPRDLGNPIYATLLMLLFEWGVAVHDLEVERIEAKEIEWSDKRDILRAIWNKGRRQVLKDYVVFPALAGPGAPFVLAGNLSANMIRNIWSFMIISSAATSPRASRSSPRRRSRTRPGAAGTCARCSARPTSPAAVCSTSSAATSHTRSSITCSRTSLPTATRRSRWRCGRSASATASSTTPARCTSSSARWSGRSCAWRCPAAAPGSRPRRRPTRLRSRRRWRWPHKPRVARLARLDHALR